MVAIDEKGDRGNDEVDCAIDEKGCAVSSEELLCTAIGSLQPDSLDKEGSRFLGATSSSVVLLEVGLSFCNFRPKIWTLSCHIGNAR